MICDVCGCEYEIGEWPYCPHGWAYNKPPFRKWVDEHITGEPVEINSLAHWNRLMRENKCDLKDQPTKGDLDARKDKCEEIKKEMRHAS